MTATVFYNARILTMDPSQPHATAVLARDGIIAAVSDDAASLRTQARHAREIDCGGALLVPAFIDAHCHLLATAARSLSVDCSPNAVHSVANIQQRLREAASRAKDGEWIRAAGYDESQLAERRHPTRRDLDAAVPHHPLRLLHRSGHALVLNTPALQAAGITTTSPEPPGAAIDRFTDDGSPSGLLIEMNDVVDRIVPPLPYEAIAPAVAATARRFLAAGVTAICDATHTNSGAEWRLFARLQAEGHLPLDVTLMEGIDHVGEMPDAAAPKSGDALHATDGLAPPRARLRRGHVKIMLHELGDTLTPDECALVEIVRDLHERGRDVAIHAVEPRAGAAAVDAIAAAVAARPRPHRHRIEHAALLPEGAATRIGALGITVVIQPAFILEHGDRYLRDVPTPHHRALYPIADLLRAGVRVAASSDAPVGPLAPLAGLRASTTRRTLGGAVVAPAQAVKFGDALAMWTSSGAEACGLQATRGRIAPGMAADLVVLTNAGAQTEVVAVWQRGERLC